MQLPSLTWLMTWFGGIYLLLLGSVFFFLGVADFSVADDVSNPSKISVTGSAISLIVAMILVLWIDSVTTEKDIWKGDKNVTPENTAQSNEELNNSGCLGISSILNKILGTFFYLLLVPLQFTKIGEWFYQIQWFVFSTLDNWSSLLPIILAFLFFLSYSLQKSFVYYVWLLGRICFLGLLFTNQVLFQYTIIPSIMGICVQLSYQLLRLGYKKMN
ncbi:hypothetical protein PCC7418_0511 [Halothece sp. PCC 7418]|uniref:hypothetical protein n=1 Tax=Halothece sp. (strain PCC 7418) TaxID=65093 RepID=UPI0002A06B56|nr:hypothetical protein [Halothece sp. PCC 7418]AFZ42740.1 hypothetical protein PCC7418_0511 [Halothece sp. PCC 7418]